MPVKAEERPSIESEKIVSVELEKNSGPDVLRALGGLKAHRSFLEYIDDDFDARKRLSGDVVLRGHKIGVPDSIAVVY